MRRKHRIRRHRRAGAWWCHIPKSIWVLLEVLVTIIVIHATHISPHELLPLFQAFAS